MTTAGELSHKVAFDAREVIDDGYGNPVSGDWAEQFVVSAKVQAKFGGESVTAARLTGQQPVTIVVRQSAQTRQIAEDWRARDVRTGIEYAIRSKVDPDDRGAWFELLTQTGVAA
jgi:hypothetical protein